MTFYHRTQPQDELGWKRIEIDGRRITVAERHKDNWLVEAVKELLIVKDKKIRKKRESLTE